MAATAGQLPADHHPDSITTATPPPAWPGSITSGGRSNPPATRCGTHAGRPRAALGDPPGLEQETWPLLALYQLLRRAMTDATATRPGADPDRASFTTALETARDQLATATGLTPPPRPARHLGHAILASLLHPAGPATAPAQSKTPAPATPATPATPAPAPSHHHRDHHHPHHTAPRQKHQARPRKPANPAPAPTAAAPGPHGHPPHTPLDTATTSPPSSRPPRSLLTQLAHLGPHRDPDPHQPRHLHPRHPALTLDKPTRPLTTRPCVLATPNG